MEKLEKLAEALVIALTGRIIGYGIVLGFVISLCVTSVTILLLSGVPVFAHHPPVENGWRFLGEFALLFVIITALTVLMTSREDVAKQREVDVATREAKVADREKAIAEREADDLLSDFRERVAGIWEMSYRSWKFNKDGEPEEVRTNTYARLDVNSRTKKLAMRIRVASNGEFDDDNISIEAISIWPVVNPRYLDYFHDLSLSHERGEVKGPVFVHLDIEFENDQPVRLKGTWYDLNGTFARALKDSFVRAHSSVPGELPLRGRIFFRKIDNEIVGTKEFLEKSPQMT